MAMKTGSPQNPAERLMSSTFVFLIQQAPSPPSVVWVLHYKIFIDHSFTRLNSKAAYKVIMSIKKINTK